MTGGYGFGNRSNADMSPAEKKYREQKDRIFGDLRSAMQSKLF
jgi:hypothetical protein